MSELVEHFEEYVRALADGDAASPLSERELQVAVAILLVQTLRADFKIEEGELEAVVEAVEAVLGLEHDEALELARLAGAARAGRERDAAGAPAPRPVPDEAAAPGARRVALADRLRRRGAGGDEEYLIRKFSGLLSLSIADLVEAKVRAKEAF